MPNPNAIVSPVLGLDPPADAVRPEALREGLTPRLRLEEGREVALDPADPRTPGFARLLEALGRAGTPVYLEVDPGRGTLTRLLIPHLGRVEALTRDPAGGLRLALSGSHALRRLPEGPDRAGFEALAERALAERGVLVVTADDAGDILDLRPIGPGWRPPSLPEPPRQDLGAWIDRVRDALRRFRDWVWWGFGCVTAARAQQVFEAMQATSCAPLSVPAPCIPFLYPDDGCFARAHEMCRLMQAMGLRPRKVWIRGYLQTPTRNNPSCLVVWSWHVAPTLCVRDGPPWQRQTMVIDPSLFGGPVTPDSWKSVQGDPAAQLDHTGPEPYFHVGGDIFDPDYVRTNEDLVTYRNALLARSLGAGPPPYANCS